MKQWALMGFLMVFACYAAAETCDYTAPALVNIQYQEGPFTPVYFSNYQFNLPAKPEALLSGEGFVASFGRHGYIGLHPLAARPWGDQTGRFESLSSVADDYRLIYGLLSSKGLNGEEQKELRRQRSLLKMDCTSVVKHYLINGSVEVVWQASKSEGEFDSIFILGAKNAELITVRLPVEEVRRVIFSIKRRR
ncbi:MAG: hypothetical protein JWR17_2670 [Pseudomonas sp.]|jgi:hypothetical protein|uniref:hypothetical protein n=1 Tax=Pseudomonas sp. TaxID=306 RepID=UPI002604DAD5|nr:hypothetical protein [Pseudomonas sp.]MDB6049924.1 hypothetical protein [Pseudomonas sp.]